MLTVTQYRYVIGKTLLEIPAGKLEPGEDPVADAWSWAEAPGEDEPEQPKEE